MSTLIKTQTSIESQESWFVTPRPNTKKIIRLFCLPYAGGSASAYRPWAQLMPREVELVAVQLPGRETRMHEQPMSDVREVVARLTEAARPLLDDTPFLIFGHNLGGLLAFEWARHLRREGLPQPEHLFVSGRGAPQASNVENPPMYTLPDVEFVERLRGFGSTPDAVLANRDLMQLVLPLLRADFQMSDAYQYYEQAQLNCPITVFRGTTDELVPYENAALWRHQTASSSYSLRTIPGDHFFIHGSRDLFMRIFLKDIYKHVKRLVG